MIAGLLPEKEIKLCPKRYSMSRKFPVNSVKKAIESKA
jgi:hypothetical protein